MEQTLHVPEAKAMLQARLRYWPAVDDSITVYLASLHWRVRCVVELTFGERLTANNVAALLGISTGTVRADLSRAYECYQEAFRGEFC